VGLRVLVLTTSYPLRPSSSSGVFVRRLVQALSAHGAMQVLCPADASTEPVRGDPGIELLPFRYAPRSWQRLAQEPGGVLPAIRTRPALLLLLPFFLSMLGFTLARRARRVDVIHANWAICGALAGLLQPLHRRPIVVTLRGDDVTVAARSGLHRRLLRLAVTRAAAVVCVAETMAQHLRAAMPDAAAKVRVVLNGVDAAFQAEPPAPPLRSVFVGSLIPRKGVDLLLQAFARLGEPAGLLRLVGDGPERERLEALAQNLGVRDRLEFIGQVAPEQVAGHLAASQVFVLPSHSEGRPNVLLEAMAGGTAVVATRIAGVVDTLADGEQGWLCEPGDVDSLSAALGDALQRPEERRRRAAAARRRVEAEGWTWPAAAQRYADVFAAAAGRAGMA
jgi:glycosyltransferase involved in cell wall biosynthesis